jgi:hypothetical protein
VALRLEKDGETEGGRTSSNTRATNGRRGGDRAEDEDEREGRGDDDDAAAGRNTKMTRAIADFFWDGT